jgi:hypothetical protein
VNITHLHLLLNHVPTVGSVVGLGLLAMALVRRSDQLLRASLEVLFLIAVATLPVYLTGTAAAQAIQKMPGVAGGAISTHETAAILAFAWMQVTGLVAWVAIWQSRRHGQAPRSTVWAVLLLSTLTVALMGNAAAIGGEIRHPEILVAGQVTAAESGAGGWLTGARIDTFVTTIPWVWPAAETLHFIGMCLTFGVLLTVNLRLLGVMKRLSFAALHRLLPWGILGFGLNLFSGMLFFIAASSQYTENIAFYWKVLALALAGAHFLFLTVLNETWTLKAGDEAAPLVKLSAVAGIGIWIGVIFWGRMLPFIGNAF